MLQCDFNNCMSEVIGEEHGITSQDLALLEPQLKGASAQLTTWHKNKDAIFLDLPNLSHLYEDIPKQASRIQRQFENLVVLGIGGSALGLRCIAHSLLHPFHNLLDKKQRQGKPRLFVCDTLDPDTFSLLFEYLDLEKTCFNVISKSGTTLETMAQFFFIIEWLQKSIGKKWKDHLIITTDPEKGALRAFSETERITSFVIPPSLGGRFSVLSPVVLFPAACVGIDIEGLLQGATLTSLETATRIAAFHFLMATKKKKTISVMMPYTDSLRDFSEWYAQLWAESLGKNGRGMTPVKALGVTDQHSQLQLYMEGPNDKLITFLNVQSYRTAPEKTRLHNVPEAFAFLEGKSFDRIVQAGQQGTMRALAQAHRPNFTITLSKLHEQSVGSLLMTYEIATVLMGALMQINPFDQPGVELSKRLTRQILIES